MISPLSPSVASHISQSLHSQPSRKRNLRLIFPLHHLSNSYITGSQMWIYVFNSFIYDQICTEYITSWMTQGTSNLIWLKWNSSSSLYSKSLDPTFITYWQAIEPFSLSMSLFMSIKNCEDSEMLPYLQTGELDFHSLMEAGRRYKTLGQRWKC